MPDGNIANTTAGPIQKVVLADPITGAGYAASGGGGGGGSGDASAANQLTQIDKLALIDQDLGAATDEPPTTDTAASSINGRLQRIAQRLSSLIALWQQGPGTEAAAQRVTLASDGPGVTSLTAIRDRLPATLGQKTPATSLATIEASAGYVASPTVTRPANVTAYTAGDVIGGAIEFTNMGPAGAPLLITDLLVFYNVAALPSGMGALRLHLYSATPPSALADNAPFDLTAGDRAVYITYIDLPALQDFGSTLITRAVNGDQVPRQVKLAAGQTSLWGYLQTIGGFTPAANSETLRIDLDAIAL
jgi:hypothetical protein